MVQMPAEEYQVRLDEFNSALRLDSPQRVLAGPASDHFFSSRQVGISNKDAMLEHEKRYTAMKEVLLRFEFDIAFQSGVYPAQWYSTLDARHYQWPGGGLPDDMTFQFVEKEYLLADEYDQFLANPNDFTLRVLWPRMTRGLEPLAGFPPLYSIGPDPIFLGPAFATEENLAVLDTIKKLAEASIASQKAEDQYIAEVAELGYPVSYVANFTPPFDLVADFLRGMRGTMLDMYRAPDKLLAAVELYIDPLIKAAIAWAEAARNPRIFFWLHKGAAGFMSDEHFQKFYWPSMRTVVMGLVEAGLIPILHVQGDYTPRLPHLAELPRGKVPIHYDRIDRQQALEIMGDRQCFWGGVSSALLSTGTPDQVKEDVKELIDMFGPQGGLIVDGSVGIPDEAKPENIAAMVDAVDQFGKS
jgi:uroporphyrinogen-III decarboxylase